jgi:hypothetical protein
MSVLLSSHHGSDPVRPWMRLSMNPWFSITLGRRTTYKCQRCIYFLRFHYNHFDSSVILTAYIGSVKMESPSPPHVRIPLQDRTLDPETIKLRFHRFLIDSIAFLYQIEHDQLKAALSDTNLVPADDAVTSETGSKIRRSILSQDERDDMLYLAVLVRNTMGKLHSITYDEKRLIYHNVYVPATELHVSEPHVFLLLRLYADHKGIDYQKAALLTPKRIPWSANLDCAFLIRRILSDVILAKALTQSREQAKLYPVLIGAMRSCCKNAGFDYNSCKDHGLYVDCHSKCLVSVIRNDIPRLSSPEAEGRSGLDIGTVA